MIDASVLAFAAVACVGVSAFAVVAFAAIALYAIHTQHPTPPPQGDELAAIVQRSVRAALRRERRRNGDGLRAGYMWHTARVESAKAEAMREAMAMGGVWELYETVVDNGITTMKWRARARR